MNFDLLNISFYFRRALPYLGATGHNNYFKSIWLYLKKMENLETTHPEVYAKFMKGYFAICRSEQPWTGIYPDLAVEQVNIL